MSKQFGKGSLALFFLVGLFDHFAATDVNNDSRATIKIPLRRMKRVKKTIEKREAPDSPEYRDNLQGRPGQGYYLAILLGTPAQMGSNYFLEAIVYWVLFGLAGSGENICGQDCSKQLNVLVDTGSSNFAVGASKHEYLPQYYMRDKSLTYRSENKDVSVLYTQGCWVGRLGSDLLRFVDGPNATVRVEVASILSSEQFFINGSMWEGILGLAYSRLSKPDSTVIPVFDQFVENGIVKDSFSMQLCGSSELDPLADPTVAGTMVFGGIDADLYDGEMLYTPIVKKWYYEVVITDIAVNTTQESLNLDCKKYNYDKTIVDSGTTNLRVSEEVYNGILTKLKKYDKLHSPDDFWNGKQMMCWTYDKTPWDKFPNLYISLLSSVSSSKHFTLKVPPQLYLRETIERGPYDSQRCYKFAITKADKGTVIGAVIMEGFYVVFDRQNSQVGFAATTCGADGRPNPQSQVLGPYSRDPVDCQYIESESSDAALLTVAYVMAAVCALCLLPISVLLIQASLNRRSTSTESDADVQTKLTDNPPSESYTEPMEYKR